MRVNDIERRMTNRTWKKCPLCKRDFVSKFAEVCTDCRETNRFHDWLWNKNKKL